MLDGVEPEARTCERGGGGAGQSLSFALRVMVEAVLVEEFAGEGTDRRVETPRSAEKEASIGWNGVVLAEQVLESRGVAAPRMATLDGLLELLGPCREARRRETRRRPYLDGMANDAVEVAAVSTVIVG